MNLASIKVKYDSSVPCGERNEMIFLKGEQSILSFWQFCKKQGRMLKTLIIPYAFKMQFI